MYKLGILLEDIANVFAFRTMVGQSQTTLFFLLILLSKTERSSLSDRRFWGLFVGWRCNSIFSGIDSALLPVSPEDGRVPLHDAAVQNWCKSIPLCSIEVGLGGIGR